MTKFVASCLGLALAAIAVLGAYTAAHPLSDGVSAVYVAASPGGRVSHTSTRPPRALRATLPPSALRTHGCAISRRLVG